MARRRPPPPRCIDPVRLALERVTGQRDPPSRLSREQSWERERDAGLIRCGDPFHEPAGRVDDRLVRVPRRSVQAGHDCRCSARRWPSEARHRPQHRVRPQFHYRIDAHLGQRLDASPERHRLPRVPPPVRRVLRVTRFQQPARNVAHQWDGRGRDARLPDHLRQVVQGRFDEHAVIAGAAPQPVHAKPFRLEPLHDLLDLPRLAAHHLVRSVVRRDAQPQPF